MINAIRTIATRNLIDEIRFIDAEALTKDHVGEPSLFSGRQPKEIMPTAKSLLIFSIYIGKFVIPNTGRHGRISRLALSGFYANIIKPLFPVKNFLESQGYEANIVDGSSVETSIPIKGAAVKAGLGWIGKNTLLLNKKYGSFQALGAILTDVALHEKYPRVAEACGTCTRCIDACPAGAIQIPRQLTRSKCLSHLLDVEGGELLLEQTDLQGYFLECDICQDACPWNRRHIKQPLDTPYGRLYDRSTLEPLFRVEHLEAMDENTYLTEIAPLIGEFTPLYRIFKRNVSMMKQKSSVN